MTSSTLQRCSTSHPRLRLRADPLAVALLVAVVAGLVTLWIALAAGPSARAPSAAARVAMVVDAGGRPRAALAAAQAAARGRDDVTIRVPRSASEAAADVRYFAAQRYGRVIAVGPAARAAARSLAAENPRTRFVLWARMR